MKKHHRLLCLLLALVLTVGLLSAGLTAAANSGTQDLDGDGVLTIHDIQLAQEADEGIRELTQEQKEKRDGYSLKRMLDKLFGRVHVPAISNGVYQISGLNDLYFVQENATQKYSYKLTKNLDLGGVELKPIEDFAGTFDGNGKTISNFIITKGAVGSKNASVIDQGFFSEIMAGASVTNLNLADAQIVVTEEKANFVGLLCGTNRGTVTGCYTHGKITDLRETATLAPGEGGKTFVAALIGRNVGDGSYTTVTNKYAVEPKFKDVNGNTTKYTLKTADSNVNDADIKIAAQLAVELADRADIQVCLSANAPKSGTNQFQDISAQWGVSATIQAKQDKVVEYMNSMGQVKWTTPADMVWIKSTNVEEDGTETVTSQTTWGKDSVQFGLPFDGMHNGFERFQSVADYNSTTKTWTVNANKAYEVITGQTTAADWYTTQYFGAGDTDASGNVVADTDVGYDGWIRYIGNDCSSAVSWAWLQISPVDAYVSEKYGIDGGGVFVDTCRHSFPYAELDLNNNDHYGHQHGLVQVGHYNFYELNEDGTVKQTFLSATKAEAQDKANGISPAGISATTSANIWDWNADNSKTAENQKYAKLYETYVQARKGDVLQTWFTGVKSDGARIWEGHMRMLAEDPVAIRNYNGTLDLNKSYFITSEHGGAPAARRSNRSLEHTVGTSNITSTNGWGLYQKYTFADLDYTSSKATKNPNDSSRCYLPISCRALRTDEQIAQKYSYTTNPANSAMVATTAPYAGAIYTNYALVKMTLHIKDSTGKEVVNDTIQVLPEGGIRSTQATYRWSNHRQKQVDLTGQFAYLTNDSRLSYGKTYTFWFELESVTDTYDAATGTWTANSKVTTAEKSFTHAQPEG